MTSNVALQPAITSASPDYGVTFPKGYLAAGIRAGLKSKNYDMALILSELPASAAGVFTKNIVAAASVSYSKSITGQGMARAIFCNAGNANACTGLQGEADNLDCARATAEALGISQNEVLVASTGIIGKPMPMSKIYVGLPKAASSLSVGAESDLAVANAILTTDLTTKQFALECTSPYWSGAVRIGGVAKGSGMIAPNMATTLCFVTTDAAIEPMALQAMWASVINRTFNRVTVDGDTSTNDMALLLANGASKVNVRSPEALDHFAKALHVVSMYLAKEVARDGEGATKLVTVRVKGASSEAAACRVAKTVAESSLVKTALFGCDPNWGRIMAAAGRAGIYFAPQKACVWIGDIQVFGKGTGLPFDHGAAHLHLKGKEVSVTVSLGSGPGEATVWTCDYSYDYIRINAEYHT